MTPKQVNQKAADVMREQVRRKEEKREAKRTGTKLPKARPGPLSNLPPGEAQRVRDALKTAGDKSRQTINKPGKNDIFEGQGQRRTGMDARRGIMNSYLHSTSPLTPPQPATPKHFGNFPYKPDNRNPALRGKRPLGPDPANLRGGRSEFPVPDGRTRPMGHHGGDQGSVRVITGTRNVPIAPGTNGRPPRMGNRPSFEGMVTHDRTGDNEHYRMTQTRPDWADNMSGPAGTGMFNPPSANPAPAPARPVWGQPRPF